MKDEDIDRIKGIVDSTGERYARKGGNVLFAGVDGGTVKIAPAGFCWQ